MSNLGKLAVNALSPAATALGPDGVAGWLTIGTTGERWSGTAAEARTARDYITGGQQIEVTQTFVGSTAEFEDRYSSAAKEYIGVTASLNGTAYTVGEISKGEAFTEITLNGEEEAR